VKISLTSIMSRPAAQLGGRKGDDDPHWVAVRPVCRYGRASTTYGGLGGVRSGLGEWGQISFSVTGNIGVTLANVPVVPDKR
jgi:hypothetical protein